MSRQLAAGVCGIKILEHYIVEQFVGVLFVFCHRYLQMIGTKIPKWPGGNPVWVKVQLSDATD